MKRIEEALVILDLELTGTEIEADGDRIVSLGAIRLGSKPKEDIGREWFFNPEKPCKPEGYKIHRLSDEFLAQQKTFKQQFFDISLFLGNSRIVHHCWYRASDDKSVDERALNAEFARAARPETPHNRWINMKKLAQVLSPASNSLNDMLDRYGINRSSREIQHGALDDARLTARLFRAYSQDSAIKKQFKILNIN